MARRSKAREIALQMLYQTDLNPDVDGQTVAGMMRELLKDDAVRQFAWVLFSGTMEYRQVIDEKIAGVAKNWSLSRMAATDRNVIRLGAFELLFTATPHRVVIDEALDLARKYGSSQSAPFVNGILDKLVPPNKREEDAGRPPSDDGGTLPPHTPLL